MTLRSSRQAHAAARVAAIAASRPEFGVSSDELGRPFGKDGSWVTARTGIATLRRLRPGDSLLAHARDAATKTLACAGTDPGEVDLVIVTSCSANLTPDANLSASLAQDLGLAAATMDINAACAGFSYALCAAEAQIRVGSANNVLIVAAEQMSALLDPADLGTSIIFGDGVGAALVAGSATSGIGPVVWGSDGERDQLIVVDGAGHLAMQGQDVFRWAVQTAPQVALEACARAGVSIDAIDVFVPHQANLRIIDAVVQRLGLRSDVVVAADIVRSGNTSSASIPLALSALLEEGRIPSGSLALLVGFGAGLAFAGQVITIP